MIINAGAYSKRPIALPLSVPVWVSVSLIAQRFGTAILQKIVNEGWSDFPGEGISCLNGRH